MPLEVLVGEHAKYEVQPIPVKVSGSASASARAAGLCAPSKMTSGRRAATSSRPGGRGTEREPDGVGVQGAFEQGFDRDDRGRSVVRRVLP